MAFRFLHVAAVAAALLASTGHAAAQGTMGTVPDPISGADLAKYADRLGLTPEQRLSAGTVHEAYKKRFTALRDGDIAQLMESMRGMQGAGVVPGQDRIAEFFDRMDRVQDRIRALDDSFFAELEPIVDDAQRPALERVRLGRARQRCRADMMMGMGRSRTVDLSEIYWEMELPADAHAQADPSVTQYERQLTRRTEAQHKASLKAMRGLSTIYAELQMEGMDQQQLMADPQALTKLIETMKARWAEAAAEMNEESAAIAELNRKSLRQVTSMMPGPEARELRRRYLRKAYPELGRLAGLGQEPWTESAPKLDGLSPAQRGEVDGIIEAYRQSAFALVDQTAEIVDADRAGFSPFDAMSGRGRQRNEDLPRRQARGTELAEGARRAVEAVVGEGRLDGEGQAAAAQPALANADPALRPAPGPSEASGTAAAARRSDPWLPAPISPRDLEDYARRLGLDEAQRAALAARQGEYAAGVDSLPALAALADAQVAPDRDIDRIAALRRQAFDAIRAHDQAFFDSLAQMVPAEKQAEVERLRLGRERRAYLAGRTIMGAPGSGSREAQLDLAEIGGGDALDDAGRASIDPLLAAWEPAAIPLLRAWYEARLGWLQSVERMSVAFQAAGDDTAAQVRLAMDSQEGMRAAMVPLRQAADRLVDLNRGTLARMLDALPEPQRRGFRRAYDRAAFPGVYEDPVCVEDHLRRAMAIKDLSADQLAALSVLAGEYWTGYDELSRAMAALSEKDVDFGGAPEEVQAYMEQQDELGRLRFDRDELSFRTISRMKGMLSPAQVESIGGLPRPRTDASRAPWQ